MDDAFPKDRAQLVGKVQLVLLHGHRIAIAALSGGFLYQMQLLDIPGNGCLGAVEALIRQRLQQLLLGLYIGIGNNLNDLRLSLCFHMHASYFP